MEYKVLKDVVGNDLLYGNTVYFTESGESVPYILVSGGNADNYLFMRQYAPKDKVEFFAEAADIGTTDSERIYEGHTLDKFLNGTFFNRFSAAWQRAFVEQKITVTRASDGKAYTIPRKVFAPSATQLAIEKSDDGTVPSEGGTYTYFNTSAKSKRRCRLADGNGDYVEWWTRSKNNHEGNFVNYYAVSIEKDGTYDATAWQKNARYTRPVLSINEDVTIVKDGTQWRVIPNLPPELSAQTRRVYTVKSGDTVELSWNGANDDDGPSAVKYRLQMRKDAGEWETVCETTETSFSKVLAYKEVLETIDFRVQAFDAYNNYSDFAVIANISVVNNVPPSAPSYLTVSGKYKGEQITVAWGNATDEDDNLSGYKLYRSVDNAEYKLVCSTSANVWRETAGDWNKVKYKVCAYDPYTVSEEYKEAALTLKPRITMNLYISDDSEIQYDEYYETLVDEAEQGKKLIYELEDTSDDETYLVIVTLDDEILIASNGNASKGTLEFDISKELWQSISNDSHLIRITVKNSAGDTVEDEFYFEKYTMGIVVSLKEPVVVNSSEVVSKFLLNIKGDIPEDVDLTVEVTNNANDDEPVWQEVTSNEINSNSFVDFENDTVQNGNAFNFKVTVDNSSSGSTGYISSINGMFGQNLFEMIFSRLDALEGG